MGLGRWFALAGIFVAYQVAEELCSSAAKFEQGWIRAWLPPLVLLAASAAWLRHWPISLRKTPGPETWLVRGLLAAMGCAIVVFAIAVPGPPSGAVVPWAQSLALVVIVPIAEELLFRGILLDQLRSSIGTAGAVAVVSLLFGWLHGGETIGVVMFLLSLLCCGAVLLTRSILWAIGLHALWNGWAVVHRTSTTDGRLGVALALAALALTLAVAGSALRPRET